MAQFAIDEILTTGIQISGFIFDVSNSIGSVNYVLTSTSSGVMWQPDSSNTDLSSLSGQIAATGTLLNNRINSLSGYVNSAFISGSGTANYVARWSNTKELLTGSIYDLGTGVGIGTTAPVSLLTVGAAGSTSAVNGITFGGDAVANLYRDTSSRLKTDGAFRAGDYISATTYLQASNGNIYPGDFSTDLRLNIGNSAGSSWDTYPIVIKKGTYVGIGTDTPSGKLHVVSSVVGETVLRTDGTNGTLFSVTDDLSDSLMSVNNSAGLPVFEVFADDRIVGGQYGSGDFVLKNNKIGIGVTNPGEKLDVNGNVRIGLTTTNTIGTSNVFSLQAKAINIQPNSSTDTLYIRYLSDGNYQLQTATLGANGGSLHLQPYGGNVGIGLINPEATSALHIKKLTAPAKVTIESADASESLINFSAQNSEYSVGFVRTTGSVNSLRFCAADNLATNEVMRLQNGNVGIGTNVTPLKLNVSGSIYMAAGSGSAISWSNDVSSQFLKYDSVTDGMVLSSWAHTTFLTQQTERARIASNGNVGIGVTNPTTLLQLKGDAGSHQIFSINRSGSTTPALYIGTDGSNNALIASNNTNLIFGKDFVGNFNEYARIDSNGNFGIGVTNPGVRLQVVNTGSVTSTSTVRIVGATGNGGGSQIEFFKGASQKFSIGTASAITGGLSDDLLLTTLNPSSIILTAGLSGLAIFKTDGKVGIGMYNPTSLLSVGGLGSTSAASGITFGLDDQANLYRSAEDTIKTDGNINVVGTATLGPTVVNGGTLPSSPTGSTVVGFNYNVNNGNISQVNFVEKRFATGTDWTTATTRIQKRVDVTDQAYIEFNPSGALYGMALGVAVGGSLEAMRILSNGNIGIGTTNPGSPLDVYKNTNGQVSIYARNPNAGASAYAGLALGNNSSSNGGGIVVFGSNWTASALYNPNGTYVYSNLLGGLVLASEAAAPIVLGTSNTERVRITTAGDVGIGTASTLGKLDVYANTDGPHVTWVRNLNTGESAYTALALRRDGNYNGIVLFTNSSARASDGGTGNSTIRTDYGNLNFGAGGSQHILTTAGNVGINNTSPSSKLHVVETTPTGTRIQLGTTSENASMNAGLTNDLLILNAPYGTNAATTSNAGAKWGIKFVGSLDSTFFNANTKTSAIYAVSEDGLGYNRGTSLAFYTNQLSDGTYGERMRIFHNGNIGIGTTQPSYKLQIVGSGTPASPTVLQVAGLNDAGGDAKLIVAQSPASSDLQLLVAGTDVRSDGFTANDQYILAAQQLNLFSRGNGSIYNTQISIGRDGGYGNISFSTAPQNQTGVIRMYINSSGNIGINTGTPQYKLDVNSSIVSRSTLSSPRFSSAGTYVYGVTNSPVWNQSCGSAVNNNATAPDGTTTAGTYTLTSSCGSYDIFQTIGGLTNGRVYTIGMWVKLGTATNFCLVVNNTVAWNTIGGKSFDSSDGLSTGKWTHISYTFTGPATGQINLHLGYHAETAVTQQTAGTVFIWNIEMTELSSTWISNVEDEIRLPGSSIWTSRGSVGIGQTNPLSKFVVSGGTVNTTTYTTSEARIADGSLHLMKTVAGGIFESIRAMNMDTTAGTTVRVLAASTSDPFNNSNGGKVFIDAIRTSSNMDLAFSLNDVGGAAPVERVRFMGNGTVGIGTASTVGKLDVYDNADGPLISFVRNASAGSSAYSAFVLRRDGNNNGIVLFTNSSTRSTDGGAGNSTIRTDYGNLNFGAGGSQHILTTGGNVGIGTTGPSGRLSVDFAGISAFNVCDSFSSNIRVTVGTLNTAGYTYGLLQTYQHNTNVAGVSPFIMQPLGGSVGIGTTVTTGLLNVARNSNTAQPIAYFREIYGSPAATNVLLLERVNNLSAATQINSNAGLRIRDHISNYSLSVEDHNSNVNFAISGTKVMLGSRGTSSLLNIGGAGSTAAASGITFGEDSVVNLYRLSASVLKTDAAFTTASLSSSSYVYAATYLQTALGQLYAGAPYGALTVYVGNTAQNAWEAGLYVGRGSYVGIGTTQPSGKLHVVSTVAGETVLRADGTNGTLFSVVDDLSDSLMSVNNSAGLPVLEVFADDRVVAGQYGSGDFVIKNNKVGIGNTNPSYKLDINGSLGINASTSDTNWPFVVSDNSSAGSRYGLNKAGSMGFNHADAYAQLQLVGTNGAYLDLTNSVGGDSNARLIYYSNNRLDLTYGFINKGTISLNSNGVGIGTTSPAWALDVSGTAVRSFASGAVEPGFIVDYASSNGYGGLFIHTNGVRKWRIGNVGDTDATNPALFIWQEGAGARMYFRNNGYIGVGTTIVDNKLSVSVPSDSALGNSSDGLRITDGTKFCALFRNGTGYNYAGVVGSGSMLYSYDRMHIVADTSNPISFHAGGGERVRIQSNGNVGIGITNPSASLHIKPNTISANGIILERYASAAKLIYAYESGADGYLEVRNGSDQIVSRIAGYSSIATYFQSNVGINTTAPTNTLQVVGQIAIKGDESADNVKLNIQASDNSNRYILKTDLDANTNNDLLIFRSNTVDNMLVLKGNGNVGIGTTNPAHKLEVFNTANSQTYVRVNNQNSGASAYAGLDLQSYGGGWQVKVPASTTFVNPLLFSFNEAERVRITSDGKLGIGITNPSTLLSVGDAGSTVAASGITFGADAQANLYRSAEDVIKTDGSLNIAGGLTVAGTANLNGHIYGQKTVTLSTTSWTTILTVNMTIHTSCYVRIGAFGDWSNHSAVAFTSELFIQNGNNSGYGEPGIILTAHDNTRGAAGDKIDIQIVDPAAAGTQNFLIQLKLISATSSTNSSLITYHVMGQQASVT